jgi:hypothetical protein
MVKGKALPGWEFLGPLAMHAGIHSIFTLMILLITNRSLWWLALVDFIVHFCMDRIKSGPNFLGRFKDHQKASYWNAFGLDQMVHHLTHYFIVWQLYINF